MRHPFGSCQLSLAISLLLAFHSLTPSLHAAGEESQVQTTPSRTENSQQEAASPTSSFLAEPKYWLQRLGQSGISFQTMLVNDWSKSLHHGTDDDLGFGRYSLDLSATLDGKRLAGLAGATGFIRLKQHQREFGETYDGATQVYSNIDAPSRTTLYEAWVQQSLKSDRLRLKAGKIDATNDFATVATSADFLNSSMGYSPTILGFPTYPEPKLGASGFLRPANGYGIGAGVFQTAGKGVFSVVEPNHSWSLGQSELPGRLSVGYWRLDGTLSAFNGFAVANTQGFYSVAEQALWRQSASSGREPRRLSAFLQLGYANGEMSPYTQHTGTGVVLQAPFSQRPQDAMGLALTQVRFSSQPAAGFDEHAERVLETYYKVSISRHVLLVQDFQLVHNPGGLRANADCPIVTPRMVISF